MEDRPFPTPEAYVQFINRKIAAELRQRREALGLSAYLLAKDARVSDQTILNLEQGLTSSTVKTLALICVRFGVTLEEFITTATGRPD